MRLVTAVLVWGWLLQGQTAGVVTVVKSSTITATAGALRCTVSTANQGAMTQIYCYSGTALLVNATVYVIAPTTQPSGPTLSYNYNGDSVAMMVWRPTATAGIQWQVTANGTLGQGTF